MRRLLVGTLALHLSACASVPMTATPPGPITIIYRDDVSNVRRLNGVARYGAVLGGDQSVPFTVENEQAEQVCNGTFTKEGRYAGKFSLSCFGGYFSSNGNYERKTGDPINHFIARGQTARGLPIMLVVGRPSGTSGSQ